MTAAQPSRPPSTAPVVWTYSSISPDRNENPLIQLMSWSRPATKPSSDIAKCHRTLPSAVLGPVSCMVLSPRSGLGRLALVERDRVAHQGLEGGLVDGLAL